MLGGLRDADVHHALNLLLSHTDESDLRERLLSKLGSSLEMFPHLLRGIEPLERLVRNTRMPSSFLVYLDRDHDALPSLLQILSIESKAIEWLVEDPDSFDWLRLSAGQAVASDHLRDTLLQEIACLDEPLQVQVSLNRFRKRETLRVICAICLHEMSVGLATQQLSWIADATIQASLVAASTERNRERWLKMLKQAGVSALQDLISVIGINAIGGQELDFESPIELVFILDTELFQGDSEYDLLQEELHRLIHRTVAILTHPEGPGYRIHLPLNLPGHAGVVNGSDWSQFRLQEYMRWIQTIENEGRTWVRLTLLKSRFIAGNPILANRFLEEFPTLVFRRYLSRSDIVGIGALKRKMDREGQALNALDVAASEVSIQWLLGWRGEIDFLIQFLQLINGGELTAVRVANTANAIDALARHGCLTEQERSILASAHSRFSQSVLLHQLKYSVAQSSSVQQLSAVQLLSRDAVDLLAITYDELTDLWRKVRQIRDHLRNDIFVDETQPSEETDLILDPSPNPQWVEQLLLKYRFVRPAEAYKHLMELAKEEVAILSTRRCRHFLSIIAAALLNKVGETPDPDSTLENLAIGCRSLGGKGILWELFSVHEPSLDLYVRLCGSSPYLLGILTNNPGKIDELLDSLMLNRLPSENDLSGLLNELCRGAEDIETIVHSFKTARHLNVGVRDILGKESIANTHRALSDIADVCIQQVIESQFGLVVKRFGIPTAEAGGASRFAVVALGKLGAREPNYHSDITLFYVYDTRGETRAITASRHHESISLEQFYHHLAQKVMQSVNRVGRTGRLYELRNWIASSNHNTTIAWELSQFVNFMMETAGSADSALARQQLCSARVIYGPTDFKAEVQDAIAGIVRDLKWTKADDQILYDVRLSLELSAGSRNLKRGPGGTLDVELVSQLLKLRNVAQLPEVFVPGTVESIERLRLRKILSSEDAKSLQDGYNFLRSVESGLRLMNTRARHDLPDSELELKRLAYVLRLDSKDQLLDQCQQYRRLHRSILEKWV